MSPRRAPARRSPWLALLVLAAIAVIALSARPARAEDARDDYADGPRGHRFRVRFDPASRVWLGASEAVIRGRDGGAAQAPDVSAGLSYRLVRTYGTGHERIIWQVDQRVIAGWVQPSQRHVAGAPALDAAVYGVFALRHDESPSMVIPSSPPISIPFPFDVGFDAEIGRVVVPSYLPRRGGAGDPVVRVGVIRAAFLVDPWRSGRPGQSLTIGVGARYDLDAYGAPSFATSRVVHRVAPMTATSLELKLQTADGLSSLSTRADVVPHYTSDKVWKLMAEGRVHGERILLALNDQPIAAVLDAGYRYSPSSQQVAAQHDARVSLGLAFTLALR